MSHGIKRVKESEEASNARRQKELSKIAQYCALSDQVLARKRANDWSVEALDLTKQLLVLNPEFYTIWNYRRNILLEGIFPDKSPKQIQDLLSADLSLTTAALRQHPKVYWIWNHRRWCLQHVPSDPHGDLDEWRNANWVNELYVVEKMLDADARNYHAWGYRRYLLASLATPRTPAQELAYTTKKIESNFSNFSAWHHRSKVYAALWKQGIKDDERTRIMNEEFELIKQAMYTDPGDQSVWLYHRWLIGSGDNQELLVREIQVIEELLEIEPNSKWCLDTLVHYKSLLLRHNRTDNLINDCVRMLEDLKHLDPFRKERYEELAQHVVTNYAIVS